MREIKFRVWNGSNMEQNVMAGIGSALYVDVDHNGEICDPEDSASLSPFNTFYEKDTPVMQFTGVKDKSGVEIYEGDIVLMDDDSDEGYKSRVYYSDGALCVDVRHCDYDFTAIGRVLSIPSIGVYSMEVIGNIYQNPELIKEL